MWPFKRTLAILTVTAAVLTASACGSTLDPEPGTGYEARWMSSLGDETPLAALSIPGAHDAATAGVTAWTQWTRTQDLDIATLWSHGVRAFDLRPAWVDGTMGIYHDKYSAHISFPEGLSILLRELQRQPEEFAVVIIRHEEEADGASPEWSKAFGQILAAQADHLASYHAGITVGELRGKVLILSRNRYEGGPFGGYIEQWYSGKDLDRQKGASVVNAAGEKSPLWVQDFYDPESGDEKWDVFRTIYEAASNGNAGPHPLVINHASGYLGRLPNYRKNAAAVNPKAADLIRRKSAPAGIVMMDFAGVDTSHGVKVGGRDLIRAIIDCNYCYNGRDDIVG